MSLTDEVLGFWFGTPLSGDFQLWWFQSSPETDHKITSRFQDIYHDVVAGKYKDQLQCAEDYLAQIIVLDQFSRNMFRGHAQAFAADPLALSLAKEAVAQGFDQQLPFNGMRAFMYLPYEHSEERADQVESIRLFTALGDPNALQYAVAHQVIIERFGRYPHRNQVLGRVSTPDELAFLQEPGSSF